MPLSKTCSFHILAKILQRRINAMRVLSLFGIPLVKLVWGDDWPLHNGETQLDKNQAIEICKMSMIKHLNIYGFPN